MADGRGSVYNFGTAEESIGPAAVESGTAPVPTLPTETFTRLFAGGLSTNHAWGASEFPGSPQWLNDPSNIPDAGSSMYSVVGGRGVIDMVEDNYVGNTDPYVGCIVGLMQLPIQLTGDVEIQASLPAPDIEVPFIYLGKSTQQPGFHSEFFPYAGAEIISDPVGSQLGVTMAGIAHTGSGTDVTNYVFGNMASGGVHSPLGSQSLSWRMLIDTSGIHARVWVKGSSEPASWQAEYLTAALDFGYDAVDVQAMAFDPVGNTCFGYFDNYVIVQGFVGTTTGGGTGGGNSVTVTSIPALLSALRDDTIDEIVVADGTYIVDNAFADSGTSLFIGSAYAGRTRPVLVHPVTPGGVVFSRGGAAGGAICFNGGAHHQTWDGFNFGSMTISSTGVIFFGGLAGVAAPHDITLRNIHVLSSCTRVNTGAATDHALYFSYALDTWGNILIENYTVDADVTMGLATGVHADHGELADAPNVPAHGVTVHNFTFHGTHGIASQQAIILWTPPMHDWTFDTALITNAGSTAVRFESRGASAITFENIVSTSSGGFYSSLGTPPTVPGCTFSGNSFG